MSFPCESVKLSSNILKRMSSFVTLSDECVHSDSKRRTPVSAIRSSYIPENLKVPVYANCKSKPHLVCSSEENLEEGCDVNIENALKSVYKFLHQEKNAVRRSEKLISLAEITKADCFMEELRKTDNFTQMCEFLKFKQNDTNVLLFCKALVVYNVTGQPLEQSEAHQFKLLMEGYFKTLNTVVSSSPNAESKYDIPLKMLPKALQNGSLQLCEGVSPSDMFDISDVNVSFLCLKSLQNIYSQTSEWQDTDFFCTATAFQVLERFHGMLASPLFSSAFNLTAANDGYDFQLAAVEQCLQFFEVILHQNTNKQAALLNYKDNLFLRCMCRLLSYCMKALFKGETDRAQSADDLDFEKQISVVSKHVHLHQSCLISALKVLLTLHPNYGTYMQEVTSILMGKLVICFLETSYSNLECKFELCLMALELMVNLTEFEVIDRKQFAKLCLMKFNIGNNAYLSVEIFIKVLIFSLKRITDLGSLKKPKHINAVPAGNVDNAFNAACHVAEEHMEKSFICSYICVYLSYFCDMKQQFFMYVCERLPVEMAEAAIIVMGKFKEFIPLMGKQNGQAFSMLDRAICIFLGMVKPSAAMIASCDEVNQ